jgi:hypothetical protein
MNFFRAVALLLFTAIPAVAQTEWPQEPSDFRGVPFGATQREVRRLLGISSFDCDRLRCADPRFVLGHVATQNDLFFQDGRFVQSVLNFRSADFDYLRDLFVQRYGSPMKTERHVMTSSAGAERENETLEWRGAKAVVVIARYAAGDALNGYALVTERSWADELERLGEQQKREAARKF